MLIRNCVMQKGEKMRLILQTESNEVTGSCHIITIERYGEKPIKIDRYNENVEVLLMRLKDEKISVM